MPTINNGVDWDEKYQCCLRHGVPQLPCSACIAEKNPNITVHLDELDRLCIDFDKVPVRDLFPDGEEWMADRII